MFRSLVIGLAIICTVRGESPRAHFAKVLDSAIEATSGSKMLVPSGHTLETDTFFSHDALGIHLSIPTSDTKTHVFIEYQNRTIADFLNWHGNDTQVQDMMFALNGKRTARCNHMLDERGYALEVDTSLLNFYLKRGPRSFSFDCKGKRVKFYTVSNLGHSKKRSLTGVFSKVEKLFVSANTKGIQTEIFILLSELGVPNTVQPQMVEMLKALILFVTGYNEGENDKIAMAKELVRENFPIVKELYLEANATKQTYPRTMQQVSYLDPHGLFSYLMIYIANNWLHPLHKFPVYGPGETGIWCLNTGKPVKRTETSNESSEVRMGIVADWASGTEESQYVADLMKKEYGNFPSWSMDLGDHYYMATLDEFRQNCFGERTNNSDRGVFFRKGSLGSMATTGNHDMYTSGIPFFDSYLPKLGVGHEGQKTTYAAFENQYWRVIMLDTGYTSWTGNISLNFTYNTRQLPPVITWLKDVVKVGDPFDKRGIVFLTHHGGISAFWQAFHATPKQLGKIVPKSKTVVWLWGHEHRLVAYKPNNYHGLNAHGRCIANSGAPTLLHKFTRPSKHDSKHIRHGKEKLFWYDNRLYQNINSTVAPATEADALMRGASQYLAFTSKKKNGVWVQAEGYNGFAMLRFKGPKLTIDYHSLLKRNKQGIIPNRTQVIASEVFVVATNGSVIQKDFKTHKCGVTVIPALQS